MLRREFLLSTLAASAASALASAPLEERICVFTDPFDGDEGLSVEEVAAMLRKVGATGPDLTLRSGGLVLPENAARDLPRAMAVFRAAGLSVPMASTNVYDGGADSQALLQALAAASVPYFKLGYYKYDDLNRWRETRAKSRRSLVELVELAKKLGLKAGFHNHSGPNVGGLLWDGWELLEGLDPETVGIYFDTGHSVIEGGKLGWEYGLRKTQDRITMVAVKDFVWEKGPKGWRTRWTPLGEGMVPLKAMFTVLKQRPFPGPISLHIEYDIEGTGKPQRMKNMLAALDRDISFLRKTIREA